MERYTEYKNCPLSGIKEIPSHWRMHRIKWLLSERIEKSKDGVGEPLSMSQKLGIVPTKEMDIIPNMASSYIGAKKVQQGDMVFNKLKAHLGVFAVSNFDGLVSPDYAVYIPTEKTYLPYLELLLRTQYYITEFQKKTTGVAIGLTRLYTDGLFGISAIYPPIAEQEKIVSYLDSKTSKIDAYVADKEKEILLLQELKQKTIAEAVTKGLNPNVKMKDSGILWIGMIPEHWEVSRMKRIFSESKEKTTDESGTLLSLSQYTGITLKDNAKKVGMFEAESTIGYNIVHSGQFVMNIMLAWNGSYAVSDYEGIISPSYCVFNFNEDCESKYFHYLLRLTSYAGAFKTMSKGIIESRLRLYPLYFFTFKTIIPPLVEQQAIVAYIDEKCQKIDTLITELQAEINYLKEYKQRLIADVVTGQVKV